MSEYGLWPAPYDICFGVVHALSSPDSLRTVAVDIYFLSTHSTSGYSRQIPESGCDILATVGLTGVVVLLQKAYRVKGPLALAVID